MIVVGLTGSIAMGKSEVAKVFRQHGIPVFDSDAEVHALYESPEGASLLGPLVPEAIFAGAVNRQLLSSMVTKDPALLPRIEALVHSEIAVRRETFLQFCRRRGEALSVIDVPLLFERGMDAHVDVTLVVSAPEAEQRRRAMMRPGMTSAKLEMILARQMPDSEKRRRADIIMDNDGTLTALHNKVSVVIDELRKRSRDA